MHARAQVATWRVERQPRDEYEGEDPDLLPKAVPALRPFAPSDPVVVSILTGLEVCVCVYKCVCISVSLCMCV